MLVAMVLGKLHVVLIFSDLVVKKNLYLVISYRIWLRFNISFEYVNLLLLFI